ncbi:class I SAM-dependent methyltransferase [Alteraurantiacibacter palmitatis]|uniref:Class I SAM-dependent methyltransferase n=1 Tax=Alteraurantiacibacter palmitatis TaxID=2054628 RepID=A0ABV7E6D6_9SPHN
MSDPDTLAFYNREAPRYTISGRDGPSRDLDAFLARLDPGARILELGCGAGKDAEHMIKRGFVVVPTDGSRAMAKRAEERLGIPVQVLSFDQLDAVEEYDAVWCHASIHHQPGAGLPDVLARIARALKPGGWHFANFKLGDGDARDMFGRLYNFPTADALRAAYLAVPGWRIGEARTYQDGGLDKVLRDWMAVTMQKDPA